MKNILSTAIVLSALSSTLLAGDFEAEFAGRSGPGGIVHIDNTASGGTYSGDVGAGHMNFDYTDVDGLRGTGQFESGRFRTFCIELQNVLNNSRMYDITEIADGPNPVAGNGEGNYDLADETEVHAVVAAAIRLGWINPDLSSTDITTDTLLSAIQVAIWQVLLDNSVVTANVPAISLEVAVLVAEAATDPTARVAGLRAMSNPDTQDMLFVQDDSPPEILCVADILTEEDTCPCDLNMDGVTDDNDVTSFSDAFANGDADFNNDGVTDFQDLLDFLACYYDPTGNCGQTTAAGDCCIDEDGRRAHLGTIRVQYTGEDCDSSSNAQSGNRFSCDGDPMMEDEVYILATDKANPNDHRAKIWFSGNVLLGQTFDIAAFNDGRDRLRNKTFVFIYADDTQDVLLQSIEFHTSCSQPIFTDDTFGAVRVLACIDDNGNPTGETQSDNGNDDVEVSIIQVSFTASDDVDDPADILFDAYIETECEQIPVYNGEIIEFRCFDATDPTSGDICGNGFGKPAALNLLYTGEDCEATNTAQDSGKYSCEGDPMMDENVFILVTDKANPNDHRAKIYFEGNVGLDEAFEATAENAGEHKFKAKTFTFVYADDSRTTLLQSLEFHTSCSQPIRIGDQYGSIGITGVTSEHGNFEGDSGLECGSEIINGRLVITASYAKLVVIAVDTSGNESICEQIICEPSEDTGDAEDCCADGNRPEAFELKYTGQDCDATNTSQDENKYSCDGDPEFAPLVYIIASDKENPDDHHAAIYFEGLVGLDESFVISALNTNHGHFHAKTFVHIFSADTDEVLQTVEFHTSCSQPLFTGDQYGSILIVDCPEPIPSDTESCCADGNKPTELDLTYIGTDCGSSVNTQDEGKFNCSGDTNAEPNVLIVVSDDSDPDNPNADTYFVGNVTLGETFTAAAAQIGRDRFHARTYVYIYTDDGNTLLQSIEFHTSCSQPLNLGDTFGGLELTACRSN